MDTTAGKKERRSLKDKAQARHIKHGPHLKHEKTPAQKAIERAHRKDMIEQGVAGIPGAGRGGPHKDKKRREESDRQRKHKGIPMEAASLTQPLRTRRDGPQDAEPSEKSASRVAEAYLKQAKSYRFTTPMKVTLGLSLFSVNRLPTTQGKGIPQGSIVWDVGGLLEIFPLAGTSVKIEALFYLPPKSTRLYFTDLKHRGEDTVYIVKALDELLEKWGVGMFADQL